MAAEKGRLFVIKRGDGTTSEAFTTIGAMREKSLTINGEAVDISSQDSEWRTLLAGAGLSSVSISGSGVFTDSTQQVAMQTAAMAKTLNNYEIAFESGDKFAGSFQCTTVEYSATHNAERTYSITLESSGTITFTPSA